MGEEEGRVVSGGVRRKREEEERGGRGRLTLARVVHTAKSW